MYERVPGKKGQGGPRRESECCFYSQFHVESSPVLGSMNTFPLNYRIHSYCTFTTVIMLSSAAFVQDSMYNHQACHHVTGRKIGLKMQR